MSTLRRLVVGSIAAAALLVTIPTVASASASPSFSGSGGGFSSPGQRLLAPPTVSPSARAAGYRGATVYLLDPYSYFTVYFKVSKGGPVLGTYRTSNGTYNYSLGTCTHNTCTGEFDGDPGPNAFSISVTVYGYNPSITKVTYP